MSLPESCDKLEGQVGGAIRDYHALYTHVDALRIKRDALVSDMNKTQDKIERLRLKVIMTSLKAIMSLLKVIIGHQGT